MRTVSRLRLLFFIFNLFSDKLSTSVLVALSKPSHPHQKDTYVLITHCPLSTEI